MFITESHNEFLNEGEKFVIAVGDYKLFKTVRWGGKVTHIVKKGNKEVKQYPPNLNARSAINRFRRDYGDESLNESSLNLWPEAEKEVQFFVEKFVQNGWQQDDTSYIHKGVDFITSPDANNEEWKRKVSLVLYPSLLGYGRDGKEVTEVWIKCRTTVMQPSEGPAYDNDLLVNVAKFLQKEIEAIGWKAFYDEDAFHGNFTRPEGGKDYTEFAFYLNQAYPEGYWENHTL